MSYLGIECRTLSLRIARLHSLQLPLGLRSFGPHNHTLRNKAFLVVWRKSVALDFLAHFEVAKYLLPQEQLPLVLLDLRFHQMMLCHGVIEPISKNFLCSIVIESRFRKLDARDCFLDL